PSAVVGPLARIQPLLRRPVQRRRVSPRLKASRMPLAPTVSVNDEELANRLTEILNLLDVLAKSLPKDAALRRFIDEAAEPLGTLLGYFAGGIDGSLSAPAHERRPPVEPY